MSDEFMRSEKLDRLEYRYDYAAEDFQEFARYSAAHRGEGKADPGTGVDAWIVLFAVILLGLVILTAFGKRWFGEQVGEMIEAGYSIVVTAGLVLIGLVIVLLIVFRVWQYRRSRMLMTLKNQACVVSAEGVAFGSELVSTLYRWPAILKVAFTPNLIAFYISPTTAFLLPKRAIESAEEAARLSDCLCRWYSGPVIEQSNPAITAASSLPQE